jgi:hypothetical protein
MGGRRSIDPSRPSDGLEGLRRSDLERLARNAGVDHPQHLSRPHLVVQIRKARARRAARR